jgi:predicted ATPase/DNA-binding SARP family transcriptional activator
MEPVPLSIHLLGPFDVRVRGAAMRSGRTRSVEWLLALLVLRQGRGVSRSWLAGTFWPESSQEQAFLNLRRNLMDLRQALGPEVERLRSPTRDSLLLDLTGATVDLLWFDAAVAAGDEASLQEAVALYRGPLLEDCSEAWIFGEREARREACLQALERLADLALVRGQPTAALSHLLRAETLDPLRDSVQRRRMQALASSGDLPAALLSYRDYRLRLHREMNLQPDPETTRLYQELQAGCDRREPGRPNSSRPAQPVMSASPNAPSEAYPIPLTRIPCPLTTLIGREQELQEATRLVTASRLVTLIGGGGVGKTRLALQVAADLTTEYPGRTAFVELAPLADPALLPGFVGAALGLRGATLEPQHRMQALVGWLSQQPALLVLDNCEHLLPAVAELTQSLLAACPELRLLATSRQRLGLTGEVAWRVPSLSTPDPDQLPADAPGAVEYALQFPAAQLFVERAAAVRPGFRLRDRDEALAAARICQRLDGIPLALELAAARTTVLNVAQIAAGLEDRFRLLTGGSRAALPRHRTLRALIDWSYDGLPAEEAALLRGLSVFAGGWTLEAAEAMADDPIVASQTDSEPSSLIRSQEVLDLLGSLEGRSLVLVEEASQGLRYRMLETVREYAREKLRECCEEATARSAHVAYFLALGETAAAAMGGPEQLEWLKLLEAERDNLRAALEWCLESAGDIEAGLRLACALEPFWAAGHYVDEGRRSLEALLSSPRAAGRTTARAAALRATGMLAALQSDSAAVHACANESLAIYEELGDPLGVARVLYLLSSRPSSWEEGRRLATRSLILARECHDSRGAAYALTRLSEFASAARDYDRARAFHREALAIARSIGDRTLEAGCLSGVGGIEYDRRDYAAARDCFRGSLALARELGWHNQAGASLYFLGRLAFQESDYPAARALWEEGREADRRNRNKGSPILGALAELATVQGDYATARARWEESLAEGRELRLPGHVAHALLGLADTARLEGDFAGALTQYRESLQAVQPAAGRLEIKIADERYQAECAACLRGMAAILGQSGSEAQATRLLGAAEALAEAVGARLPAAAQASYQEQVAALRRAMGAEAFAATWAEGRTMSLEKAIDDALTREEAP